MKFRRPQSSRRHRRSEDEMTYTPEQLREEANTAEADHADGHPLDISVPVFVDLCRAHADALEEIERLRREAGAYRKDMILANDRAERAEAALADAERKGREQGMREAAAIVMERSKRHADARGTATEGIDRLSFSAFSFEAAEAYAAIIAAIEGKK